jgi:ABC-type antimicrobial peptide transport system permease subunit
MIRSYFKTAWRNLVRNRIFSSINVLGLTLGLTSSLLIFLWVNDERSKDTFHKNDDRLYAVYERQYHDGQIDAGYYTPGLLADELKATFPEVEYGAGMAWNELNTFEANGKILKEDGSYAGVDFFSMFSYPLLQGDASIALKSPVDIAISRKMAEDFFGSVEEALGKPIRYQNRKDLRISAVFENISPNSSVKFDYLINWETFLEDNSWAKEWGNNGPAVHLALRRDSDVAEFRKKIKKFIERFNKEENFRIELDVQRYSEQYLHSNFKNGEFAGGRIQYVRLFSVVAVFILMIACINFMNLTTARSVKRAKEIGIRKVVGALRSALVRQFMGEALLIVTISFLLSLLLVALLLPAFNSVVQKQISIPFGNISFLLGLGLLTLLTGLVSGSYPALYLSSFNPVRVFKGTLKFSSSALWFRQGLVVFQFVLSIVLIIGTIVISKQVNYVQSIKLGYDRENLIYVPLEGALPSKYIFFKEQLLAKPGIQTVSRITQSPTSISNGTGGVEWEGKDPSSMLQFTQVAVGYDFASTMRVEMLQGRDFSNTFVSDSVGYIVNETALKLFNYKDPVGMPLTFWQNKGTIVGVIKDFHFNSLHHAINPLVIRLGEDMNYGWALIRTEPGKTKEALASLEKLCMTLNPQFPFTYQFSDEEYEKMYQSEQIVSKLSNGFAFLAVFISCLGLLGLTMFTAEQRTKEIGIRKILGASMVSLFNLLSREIFLMVAIALLIASPLGWYVMDSWLSDYAYRTDIAWWIFLIAGSLAILIALVTVSFQTIKALLINPANSLRSE